MDRGPRSRLLAKAADSGEATWRERALNAEDALKSANAEIFTQRTRIGELLGRIRDLEAECTEDDVQRITTENSTLKQRVRQLPTDNRTLEERLKAARSNQRFQDRRIADLEAQIADPGSFLGCSSRRRRERPCQPLIRSMMWPKLRFDASAVRSAFASFAAASCVAPRACV
jgi:hypothetical protein